MTDFIDDEIKKIEANIANLEKLQAEVEGFKTQLEDRIMRTDRLCEKCGVDLGFGWDDRRHEVKLVGGYKANICTSCTNLWHEHLNTVPQKDVFDRLRKNDVKIATIRECYHTTGGDHIDEAEAKLQPLYDTKKGIEQELFQIGKAWVAQKLPSYPTASVNP
jgi:hypothetical protein